MSLDLRADLTADLLRDLEVPAGGASAGGASAGGAPVPASGVAARRTPALSLTITPLQWSWPVVRRARSGTGVVAGLGPWSVELSV